MIKFSVVISAYNEEKKIKDCLESVKWADEIILINNSSTDNTVELAKKYTSNIFTRKNNLMLNINKNFGFTKATGDWILNLDADERVTPELKEEILRVIHQPLTINGYFIPRKNIIFGKWIKHAGWYPDHQLRLFKKGEGKFLEKHVHEMVQVAGETGNLKEHIVHYNYDSTLQFLKKLIIYSPNEAEQLLEKGYSVDWKDAIRMPSKEFLSRFFAREGYKDGFHGLMISLLMAFYHFVIFALIWEKQGFKEIEITDFFSETEGEFKKTNKDIRYWFSNEKLKKAGIVKRFLFKLSRKI